MPLEEKSGYLNANYEFHKTSYTSGYGITYPEGHVIRVYHRVLKYELGYSENDKGRTFLDFGCGNATHAFFFATKNFDVYGVDSDPVSIEVSKKRAPEIENHFAVIDPKPSQKDYFPGVQFDVILANQVLYYLSDSDLNVLIQRLWEQTKPGGVLVASMMASEGHRFYKNSTPAQDGLRCVRMEGREKGEFYINFTHDKEQLKKKFARFKPLHVGHYEIQIREEEGPGKHFLFVGQKI